MKEKLMLMLMLMLMKEKLSSLILNGTDCHCCAFKLTTSAVFVVGNLFLPVP